MIMCFVNEIQIVSLLVGKRMHYFCEHNIQSAFTSLIWCVGCVSFMMACG